MSISGEFWLTETFRQGVFLITLSNRNDRQTPGLGNNRGFYCNSNSGRLELQGIGKFLSPLEFYWKEFIRTWKAHKRIGKYSLLGNSNKRAILSTNIELGTVLCEILFFCKARSLNSHGLIWKVQIRTIINHFRSQWRI